MISVEELKDEPLKDEPKRAWEDEAQPPPPTIPDGANWGDRDRPPRIKKIGKRFSCCVWEHTWGIPVDELHQMHMMSPDPNTVQAMLASKAVIPVGMGEVNVPDGFFDAHAHLVDFTQHSEGIGFLLQAMDEVGVSHAALTGCPLKKNWSEYEETMAPDAWNDTDTLYYFSLTDLYLIDELKTLPPPAAARFKPMMSGFRPMDKSASAQIEKMISRHPEIQWAGLGKIYSRSSEITTLTVRPIVNTSTVAFDLIMSQAHNSGIPVIIKHDACSSSNKPYKYGFDFIPEFKACLRKFPQVDVLWTGAGMFARGQWGGFKDVLEKMLNRHKNLYVSMNPSIIECHKLNIEDILELTETYPDRWMVGSSTMGTFKQNDEYKKDWDIIKQNYLNRLSRDAYQKVRFDNAKSFFRNRPAANTLLKKSASVKVDWFAQRTKTKNTDLHNRAEAREKDRAPPPEKNRSLEGMMDGKMVRDDEIKHVTIDSHLHMLDFLHKSSGTRKILQAMDGCGVEKAVLIGMPCCKKWSKDEPEAPLYYQDDDGECYVYSYSDQMVADAWLALPDEKRWRFAPVMAGFNPTDLYAIAHVRRMWDKYPGLWRGLGEVMCRHDDLTMMLQDKEAPVIHHMAMKQIYEFCIEKDINCLVHHNADRTAKRTSTLTHEYLWEVKIVLDNYPDLKLIWCHAGASRRTHEKNHHEMIDDMLDRYPNLMVDISWVVWEDVICDPTGRVKTGWVDVFKKHASRFTIGSDQVGQFITPAGGNLLKPEIIKYWQLAEELPKDIAKLLFYGNAERIWFTGWTVPTTDMNRFRLIEPCMKAETLYHNEGVFKWDNEELY